MVSVTHHLRPHGPLLPDETERRKAPPPQPPLKPQPYRLYLLKGNKITPPLPSAPRCLIVRRDGSAITQTPMELRDALNKALGFVAIQSVQVSNSSAGGCTGNVSLTLMENLLATKLYAKVGEHLSTISGACSLHLDNPIVQMVVHGIPTSLPFESLQQELTTYNPGLVLASPPRWLTKPDQRREKRASSVVISLCGKKAQEVTASP
jgi:hypothetical protein